jgi:hypothetical protein
MIEGMINELEAMGWGFNLALRSICGLTERQRIDTAER